MGRTRRPTAGTKSTDGSNAAAPTKRGGGAPPAVDGAARVDGASDRVVSNGDGGADGSVVPTDGRSPSRQSLDAVEPVGEPHQPSNPCVMVIFGATGDLTKRKLVPALYNLASSDLLSHEFAVVGLGRTKWTTEEFRQQMTEQIREFATQDVLPKLWRDLVSRLYYLSGDLQDRQTYERLRALLVQVDADHGTRGDYFFYLATAPEFFGRTVQHLGAVGLTAEEDGRWRRVIIEKPFGHDLDSARLLNREISAVLGERQIYRIDHYLGKETVQNILVFRFANGIFEPIWNRQYVDHVQITVSETVGVESRGDYYEGAGALRDMVPNHIFQLISLTAMEPPVSFAADAVRDEQSKVLHAIQDFTPEDVLSRTVRGQYGPGTLDGSRVPGYRAEPKVDPDSRTETFVALKLAIDNWRWAGVPFYLRTGKRLPAHATEIAIQFKRAPHMLFRDTPIDRLAPNRLVLRIQPDEGISLRFGAKVPGTLLRLGAVDMDFSYHDYFGSIASTGYERLLYDCMIGDATLFQRADMVEAGWAVVEPVLDIWRAVPPRTFPNYAAGSWGPKEADELLQRDDRRWIPPGA